MEAEGLWWVWGKVESKSIDGRSCQVCRRPQIALFWFASGLVLQDSGFVVYMLIFAQRWVGDAKIFDLRSEQGDAETFCHFVLDHRIFLPSSV